MSLDGTQSLLLILGTECTALPAGSEQLWLVPQTINNADVGGMRLQGILFFQLHAVRSPEACKKRAQPPQQSYTFVLTLVCSTSKQKGPDFFFTLFFSFFWKKEKRKWERRRCKDGLMQSREREEALQHNIKYPQLSS